MENDNIEIKENELQQLCEALSNEIGPCPKCSMYPAVIAIFNNDESNEIIGFKVICACNGKDGHLTQEEIAALPLYTNIEKLLHIYKK